MRVAIVFSVGVLLCAQAPDPAYEPLARAYAALSRRDYDLAIPAFLKATEAAPDRASIRKDLAYAYLKIGETERDPLAGTAHDPPSRWRS